MVSAASFVRAGDPNGVVAVLDESGETAPGGMQVERRASLSSNTGRCW